MIRRVARVLSDYRKVERALDERPRPASAAVELKALQSATQSLSGALALPGDAAREQQLDLVEDLVATIGDLTEPASSALKHAALLGQAAAPHPRHDIDRVCLAFASSGGDITADSVSGESLTSLLSRFSAAIEQAITDLAQTESRGRSSRNALTVTIADLVKIVDRYNTPTEDGLPENSGSSPREAKREGRRARVLFVKTALDAAEIPHPQGAELRRLIPL